MPDALRRAIRTLAQFLVSAAATAAVNAAADGLTPAQKVLVLAGFQFAVTWAHNALEDSPAIPFPAVLKAVPSAGTNPVTVDPPRIAEDGPEVERFDRPAVVMPAKTPAKKKAAAKRAPAKKAATKRARKDAGQALLVTIIACLALLLVVLVIMGAITPAR